MSALAELQSGQLGEEFLLLLRRTIRAVAVARNFPPPDGRIMWDDESVGRIVSDFISDAQTPRRLTDLASACADDDALRARLQGTVRNFLADLGRRTPIGKLVLRINEVLSKDERFVRVEGRWARSDGPTDAGTSDDQLFDRAIGGHDVIVPAWGHGARRSPPVAAAETIVELCLALLDAAHGSLTARSLASAIGRRLGIGQAPLSLDINALDGSWAQPKQVGDLTGDEALRMMHAAQILEQLNDRERLAVAFPDYTVRDLAPVLGVNRSQAHVIRRRAIEVLKTELIDDPDAEGVAMQVIGLAREWADEWTRSAGSTS